MIDLKMYLEYSADPELFAGHIEEIREYNKFLIEKYPWVEIKNKNDFDPYPEKEFNEDTRYNWTWLDAIEPGWRIAFGEQLCEELQEELTRVNYVNEYLITDIKEKFGVLNWHSGPIPSNSKLYDIVEKYEDLSAKYCMQCGNTVEWMLDDPIWIYYYCDTCMKKGQEQGLRFKRIHKHE